MNAKKKKKDKSVASALFCGFTLIIPALVSTFVYFSLRFLFLFKTVLGEDLICLSQGHIWPIGNRVATYPSDKVTNREWVFLHNHANDRVLVGTEIYYLTEIDESNHSRKKLITAEDQVKTSQTFLFKKSFNITTSQSNRLISSKSNVYIYIYTL